MKHLETIAHDWAVRCFGAPHIRDHRVRALRIAEEAVELAQSLGVSKEQAHLLVDTIYSRPPGPYLQEMGGVALTLAVLCRETGIGVENALQRELLRVLGRPVEHFANRNKEKLELGLK